MPADRLFEELTAFFDSLPDPRLDRCKRHELSDILLLSLFAVLSGADSWTDIELFGKAHKSALRQVLKLPNGVPSHDTIGRVFSLLSARQFEHCFIQWAQSLMQVAGAEIVAIDGKSLRRSFDQSAGKNRLHLVSAFATSQGLTLGQLKTADHSNEITAIPELIDQLDLKGTTVTIDAMGCQREIVERLRGQEADYVLALKGNQGTLHEDVELYLTDQIEQGFRDGRHDYYETVDKGHGRVERRRYWVTDEIDWLRTRHPLWRDLMSIGVVESCRQIGAESSCERRFYISSKPAEAKSFAQAVRQHWGIENQLHWILDMTCHEDQCRVRQGNAAEHFSILRRIAMNLLKREGSQLSMKAKRKKAGWDFSFLCHVLACNGF